MTVVLPPYVTPLPVRVVVAAPDWVNDPLPLTRDSTTALLVFRTTSEPLLTTLYSEPFVCNPPSPPVFPLPSRSTAPFSTVVEPS